MLKTAIASFALAFQNIRSHFFHTLLSVLGIVIGVAALVAILSLIDGMEKYARDQIARTTSLKAVTVTTQTHVTRNGVSIRKDSVQVLNYAAYQKLKTSLSLPVALLVVHRQTGEVARLNDTLRVGTQCTGIAELDTAAQISAGRFFSTAEIDQGLPVALISAGLAKALAPNLPAEQWLGQTLLWGVQPLQVVGVIRHPRIEGPELFYPITRLRPSELQQRPPVVVAEAARVEDVAAIKAQLETHLKNTYGAKHDFSVSSNEFRVAQAAKGFKLFRLIMGLIVGISVAVGGIGVMNVLLISVTERTLEIGIRKAVGATRRDIVLQFLSESITVSLFGSLVGLALGIAGTLIFVPIIKAVTEVPFQAAYTWNTLLVISVLAVAVGVVFGTYPALRASRLDPVEAIRRE